jgi:hypothetical protein
MEALFKKKHPEMKSVDEITHEKFEEVVWSEGAELRKRPASQWEFGGLKRGPDGRFNDAELGELIKNCIEEPAHAFGAHGTPSSLKYVEIMGMLQARNIFNVCTLNE